MPYHYSLCSWSDANRAQLINVIITSVVVLPETQHSYTTYVTCGVRER